ncbi:hypothetical protein BK767_02040 [Bacillus thuringiensis serovar kyushuensis]|uniref:hypothetical protein n=1 Tax=Bacillus thuringiensis TaxID=1428 RepID=UPI000B43ABFD|nr:hypothetical protein [Bacillus thuringiensis]MEC2866378.1 hypothetical protein [Bacillus cereus]OTZ63035.1 hypothetical protein BK768_31975 [Bacillus thuringiensis serovar tohokuensis]OTZ79378.1 hypothetical protein BK767_02040 [Bacillus thuringiensis serovar kyushuensis]OUB97651.1 hypothetical protein BK773_02135 [Bacillus thuringiensis serovar indiana]
MKKPFYKKWWFWVITVIIVAVGIGGNNSDTKKETTQVSTVESKPKQESEQQSSEEKENKKKSLAEEKERLKKEKEEKKKTEALEKDTKKKKDENTGLTVDTYTKRINDALEEMGEKTKLKVSSTNILEDGKTAINLSPDIIIFLETDKNKNIKKASLAMTPNAYFTEIEDFKFAFLLLIGTMDDSLSFGDRNLIKQKLGINDEKVFSKDHLKSFKNNGIRYTYKGSIKDNFILQAEY